MLIIPQFIEVTWSNPTKKHYETKGYKFTRKGDTFLCEVNHLPIGSNKRVNILCDKCGDTFSLAYCQYNNRQSKEDLCSKCKSKKVKVNCSYCNKDLYKTPSELRYDHYFCNNECQGKYNTGSNNVNYNSVSFECDNCKKEILVKSYVIRDLNNGKRKNVFCSVKCKGEWESKNIKRERNLIEKKCKYCKRKYEVIPSQKDRSKYCSVECRQLDRRNKIKLNCDNCGIEIERTPSAFKKSKNHFCSNDCANQYSSKINSTTKPCEECGKEFTYRNSLNQRFCSIGCQGKWQSKTLVGINANGFNHSIPLSERIVICDWCGDEFQVKSPYHLKQIQNNQQHSFCSIECRQDWYSFDYSQSDEWRKNSAIRAAKMISDGIFKHTDTECQIKVNNILDALNIKYINEYNCKYVVVDNYLPEYNLMIEVMGTFWHADHRVYQTINYQNQKDRIKNDKIKNSYIKNNYNIDILYLWEKDITENELLVQKIIESYIIGNLHNYHSFNYEFKNDNNLFLKQTIEKPYMEYSIEKLHEIIEIKDKEKYSRKQVDKWITFNCEYCGKEKEQLISHYDKNKTHCCSKECAYKLKVRNNLLQNKKEFAII